MTESEYEHAYAVSTLKTIIENYACVFDTNHVILDWYVDPVKGKVVFKLLVKEEEGEEESTLTSEELRSVEDWLDDFEQAAGKLHATLKNGEIGLATWWIMLEKVMEDVIDIFEKRR